jgi:hypothetical protein
LLRWWVEQNAMNRHIWAGNAPYRVTGRGQSWPVREIVDQIELTRAEPGATGNVHFSMASFLYNRGGIADTLTAEAYTRDALVPATTWLDAEPPPVPEARIEPHWLLWATLALEPAPGEPPFLWAIRVRFGEDWQSEILPASQRRYLLPRRHLFRLPDEVVVSAVDRSGNESGLNRMEVRR